MSEVDGNQQSSSLLSPDHNAFETCKGTVSDTYEVTTFQSRFGCHGLPDLDQPVDAGQIFQKFVLVWDRQPA